MKLTKAAIEAFRYEGESPAKDVRYDEKLGGFGVRVWPSGAKTFIFEYRTRSGRKRYLTLGKADRLSLEQARTLALQAASQVARGLDPAETKRQLRMGETVADLCAVYVKRHAKPHNKSWAKDEERINRFVIPALGTLKIREVQRVDVARLHQKIGQDHPTTANRVLALISSMYNRARLDFGLLPQSHPNPTEGIRHFKEAKRRRFVTATEMPALAKAIDGEQNTFAKALIWLYLLTGARKSELLTLTWEKPPQGKDGKLPNGWVDLAAMMIFLPDTKTGEPHEIPVSPLAAELLRRIPRLYRNPYVFCGDKLGCHLVNIAKPWGRIRKAAGLTDVRIHDLRRTAGSWLRNAGHDLHLIGKVLNHAHSSTTEIYARFEKAPLAKALADMGQQMKAAVEKDPEAHGALPSLPEPPAGSPVDKLSTGTS